MGYSSETFRLTSRAKNRLQSRCGKGWHVVALQRFSWLWPLHPFNSRTARKRICCIQELSRRLAWGAPCQQRFDVGLLVDQFERRAGGEYTLVKSKGSEAKAVERVRGSAAGREGHKIQLDCIGCSTWHGKCINGFWFLFSGLILTT